MGAVLFILGACLIAGVFIYVYFTNREMSRAQSTLEDYWELAVKSRDKGQVDLHGGIARLVIPKIDLDYIVVELSSSDDQENLKRGPGHVPNTAYPGTTGNFVVAGHRTTYGAPFRDIDQLKPGDKVTVETLDNKYSYKVTAQLKVPPTDTEVLRQDGPVRITLSACDPPYSAKQRLIVIAELVPN